MLHCDSMGTGDSEIPRRICEWLDYESQQRLGVPFNANLHSWEETRVATAAQENGYDCGVYVCETMNCFSGKAPFICKPGQMKEVRRRITLELAAARAQSPHDTTYLLPARWYDHV